MFSFFLYLKGQMIKKEIMKIHPYSILLKWQPESVVQVRYSTCAVPK